MTAETPRDNWQPKHVRVEHHLDGLTLTLPAPSDGGMVSSCGFGLLFLLGALMGTGGIVAISSKYPHAGDVFGLLQFWLVMGALIWLCWLWFKSAQRQALYFTVDRDHLLIGYVGLRPDGSVTMPRMSVTVPRKNVTGVVVGSHFRKWTEEWSGTSPRVRGQQPDRPVP